MTALQAPVHYAVQTSPTRAGSYSGPFQIINPSADAATVWVADNAGLQIGQGTPVYPGTSLTWNKDGDLWAVAEDSGTQIIISYDVSDWEPNPAALAVQILNSGVLIIDQPDVLLNDTIAGPGTTSRIDVSRYQSISVNISAAALAAGVSNTISVAYYYTDDPSELAFAWKTVELTAVGGLPGSQWFATIPVVGSHIALFVWQATSFAVSIVGSHRPQETMDQTIAPEDGTNFWKEALPVIANNGTASYIIPPWFGEVQVEIYAVWAAAPTLANVHVTLEATDPSTGAYQFMALGSMFTLRPATTTAAFAGFKAVSAGESLRITLRNTGATQSITSGLVRITPINGYGGS